MSAAKESPTYRPDIDGLRALAVMIVIMTHAGIWVSGGFVGVDVFFVISGYLITGIIVSEVRAGNFSIARFYRRRVLRIAPALIVVIAATLLAGYFLIFPIELADLSGSALAALLSASNFYFWRVAGYFTGEGQLLPLLHTWSLGIEEQFYILVPLLLAQLGSRPRAMAATIAAICVASFALSVAQVEFDPRSAFYLLPSRAWELGLGALLTLAQSDAPKLRVPPVVRELAATAGAVSILLCVLFYQDGSRFPGLAALPPCLGAALIIWAGADGQTTLVTKLLSWSPVVFVGKISYSLYLWHWPIISLVHLTPDATLQGKLHKALFLATVFTLATLTWWFVERPFRRLPAKVSTPFVFAGAGAAASALAALALVSVATTGFSGRLTAQQAHVQTFIRYDVISNYDYGRCFLGAEHTSHDYDEAHCLNNDAHVLLLGDSFAAHLLPGLKSMFGNVRQATAAGCKPLVDTYKNGAPACVSVIGRIFSPTFAPKGVDTIVLSARWNEEDVADVRATAMALRAKAAHIVVVGPLPLYTTRLPRLMLYADFKGERVSSKYLLLQQAREMDRAFAAALAGLDGVS